MAKDSFFILLRYLLDFVCKDTVFYDNYDNSMR